MKINQLFFILFAMALPLCAFSQNDGSLSPDGQVPQKKEKAMQKKQATEHMTQMSEQEMMEKWMETIKLGPEHEHLAESVGEYTYKSKMWTHPGAEPMESEGKTTIEAVMDGRYFVEKHSGSAMGMPFEGFGISAYDNVAKKYLFTWMDNMSTGMINFKGYVNDKGQMISVANTIDPMTGFEQQHKVVSENTATGMMMDYYIVGDDGVDFRTMHIDYTRVDKK